MLPIKMISLENASHLMCIFLSFSKYIFHSKIKKYVLIKCIAINIFAAK